MRIAGLIQDSIVDGPGFRFVVFTQGCEKKCDGCHNPATWDIEGGTETPIDDIITQMLSNPLTDGITISGGEPLLQAGECALLAAAARDNGMNVWIYSGYTYDEITALGKTDPQVSKLIELTDVLVDGAFVASKRDLTLKWRGSSNQRIIDVAKSQVEQRAIELDY